MKCLIFDLDGTLVDSESLCNQVFLNLLPELDDSLDTLTERYRGIELAKIFKDLEMRLNRALPSDFLVSYRSGVAELFEQELQPVDGAAEILAQLDNRKCIASSGPLAKITLSLRLTGLAPFFGENIFSAYEVKSFKPDPGLFLHAADAMGVTPADCIVIEDSEVGLVAAHAAGMQSIHYHPESTKTDDGDNATVLAASGDASHHVASLYGIPDLVALLQSA